MAILHAPDSAYAQEMVKWEAQGSTLGMGLRPYVRREFPMMLHKVGPLPQGGVGIIESVVVGQVITSAQGVPMSGSDDPVQRKALYARGFRDTPLEALEVYEAEQLEHAKLHAEREWEKRHRLSPKAVAEVETVEAERGATHLPTIPETPIRRRRGRPPKKSAPSSPPEP